MTDHLLEARQVARFVADGFLRFDALVPDELNRAVHDELRGHRLEGCRYNDDGIGFDEYFASSPAYLSVIRLPQVQGMIESLVGPGSTIDHCAVHTIPGGTTGGQSWHADATIDPRTEAFDIQIFYYPHDTPREAGGTMFVPGSHFRRVHEFEISRYHNIRGQVPMICPAGTIVVGHHGMWHCGQPNRTQNMRYMIKLRLNPTVRQRGLFDAPADAEKAEKAEEIKHILSTYHAWTGVQHRLEILQRLRLWRSLTGSDFDAHLWLHRLENEPQREAVRTADQVLAGVR